MLVEITIPAHNEERILEENIKKLLLFLKRVDFRYNVTIAENASKDKTLEIAKKIAKRYKKVKVFHTDRPGRGNAIKQVWKKSKADLLCFMDADLSTDLNHLIEMVHLLQRYDVVNGNRLDEKSKTKRRIYRTVLSKGYNALVKYFLKIKSKDMQCGFKGIRKNVFLKLVKETKNDGFFFDTELMAWAEKKNYRIGQIPIKWIERKDSKVKIYSTVKGFLIQLYQLRKRLKNKGLF